MEKRKGYKSQEEQNLANKRHEESSPEIKEKYRISRLKSSAKRFIRENATTEDMEELRTLMKEREAKIMTFDQKIRKIVAENGEAFALLTYRFTVPYKNRQDGVDAWEAKETDFEPHTTDGPFLSEEEAVASFEPRVYKHTYNGSWLCFETARVVAVYACDLEEWGDDDAEGHVDFGLAGTDWLGRDEAEAFGKAW